MWRWLRALFDGPVPAPPPPTQPTTTPKPDRAAAPPPAGSDRQAALDAIARDAIDAAVTSLASRTPRIAEHFFYGATAIDGRHLTPWFLFRKESELRAAKASGLTAAIERRVREELLARGWPADALPDVAASFTTQQDIQRRTGGDYWAYFR